MSSKSSVTILIHFHKEKKMYIISKIWQSVKCTNMSRPVFAVWPSKRCIEIRSIFADRAVKLPFVCNKSNRRVQAICIIMNSIWQIICEIFKMFAQVNLVRIGGRQKCIFFVLAQMNCTWFRILNFEFFSAQRLFKSLI